MKKSDNNWVFIIFVLSVLTLIGSLTFKNIDLKDENKRLESKIQQIEDKKTPSKELQRFKVKVIEVIDNDYYIVEKNGYTIGGIYYLETNNENLEVGDIVYIIVLDNYNCKLFSEYMEVTIRSSS